MITAQLKASFMLLILFLAISIGAKAIGTLQPPNPALRGFTEGCEDKPQPCWYGIVPGVTTLEQAQTRIIQLGYYVEQNSERVIYFYSEAEVECHSVYITRPLADGEPFALFVNNCDDFRLGDSLRLSPPEYITPYSESYRIALDNFYTVIIEPCYQYAVELSPDMPIDLVFFPDPGILKSDFAWHGFVYKWRYCQLEPGFTGCPA